MGRQLLAGVFAKGGEGSCAGRQLVEKKELSMSVVLIALLVIIVLALLGFGLHFRWWIALIALVVWLLGFALRMGEGVGGSRRRRWYRW
jgi:1,4-dihydroxy-2-naphthoate octaprenyltransferase